MLDGDRRRYAGIDLTTLSGDDTPGNVQRLCAKAMNPVRADVLTALGCSSLDIKCGAVCVYPSRVCDAVTALKGSGIPVASVATGFPAGNRAAGGVVGLPATGSGSTPRTPPPSPTQIQSYRRSNHACTQACRDPAVCSRWRNGD